MEFVVLPDRPTDVPVAGIAGQIVPHASGHPWIAGHWEPADLTLVTAGPRRLAVLGRTRLDPGAAARALGRARTPADLDPLLRGLPGAVHACVSMDGHTRTQGSVATARQVFHTRHAGVTVAASSPRPLAELTGAGIDPEALALRLVTPKAPWPLPQRCLWAGVEELPFGSWLAVDPAGRHRTVAWWTPPPAELPIEEGAAVRAALLDAVAVRTAGRATISADLGGADSTGLCFLVTAADPAVELLTCHLRPMDRANDDTVWADRAAALLPAGRHRAVPMEEAPGANDPLSTDAVAGDFEGPPPWDRGRAYLTWVSRTFAAEGSRLHLTGLGGDELFGALPVFLWSLARAHPLTGLPFIRRSQLMNRWRLGATVRGLLDRTPYAAWLRSSADTLADPPPPASVPSLGWGARARMPRWASADAADMVRRALRDAAERDPQPLDPDRYRHQILLSVAMAGAAMRQLSAAQAATGVAWDAPYLDDRVVEAAMSVRVEDRAPRGRYKPILMTALRGVLPDPLLQRRSKGEYSVEAYDGLRRNRGLLLDQCDDLRLARLGLVDAAALRSSLLDLGPEFQHLIPFDNTLACETWLRAHDVRETIR